jgi:DNA-directed RNA polymerase specialized sigma24 family protein
MKPRNDEQLLRAWSRDRCKESFRALAERYANLVYGTAARRMADRQLAEEVSQNVIITLAKGGGEGCRDARA